MKKINKCPVCESKRLEKYFVGEDKLLGTKGKYPLSKCVECNASFLNPQPSNDELKKHYSKDKYYSLQNIDESSLRLKLKLKLYNTYFNKSKTNLFERILYSPFKFIIRGTNIIKGNKILDVGSGSGQFIYEMKRLGMDSYGIEPSDFDEKTVRKSGLNVKKGFLKRGIYKKNFFDVITINHVLEHVSNPREVLEEIHNILKPGGVFIVGVPNSNSIARKIFEKNWLAYDVPRHLINYSDENLPDFLNQFGFKVKNIRYNSRPNQFSSSIYFFLNIRNRSGPVKKILEILFIPITWIVNIFRVGDQIEVWCQKSK